MYLEEIIKKEKISKLQLAMKARIAPSDLYQAFNGKRYFFPAWRRRIAEVLNIPEDELFSDYDNKREGRQSYGNGKAPT